MLRKTGYSLWPWANVLCQKDPCIQTNTNVYDSANELLKFSCKIAGFRKATLISSRCCCCYCIIFEKNGSIAVFFTKKRLSNAEHCSKIGTKNCHKISSFLRKFPWISHEIGRFFYEFDSERPVKFNFLSATYQKLCLMSILMVYLH